MIGVLVSHPDLATAFGRPYEHDAFCILHRKVPLAGFVVAMDGNQITLDVELIKGEGVGKFQAGHKRLWSCVVHIFEPTPSLPMQELGASHVVFDPPPYAIRHLLCHAAVGGGGGCCHACGCGWGSSL